ncbi:allantoinase [Daphnia magna]|uniref:allantoinase n=1 Tax=Daphnia magna TaxID=35525 RepID=UPI001E1BBA4C|nr:allantoinase [Daphnia magna]
MMTAGLPLGINDEYQPISVIDLGNLVLSPGVVDSHVHVNEPGRTHWEGFTTATRAAAAGGVTTIVDMPLNSIPPTTTKENFLEKFTAASDNVFVDVAFWGGIIPGNQDELIPLLREGVRGFKCFMCPSGVDEFPQAKEEDLEIAFQRLQNSSTTILFHAEVECCSAVSTNTEEIPSVYQGFLQSRPGVMEVEAIRLVIELCRRYRVQSHIVHLSCAEAIPLIAQAKKDGVPITVETCPHYLTLSAEEVPVKATQFKCCPPIRDKSNQDLLWSGLLDGTIDLVVSDHSPAPQDLKCVDTGDFMKAWGGISSLQLVLPLLWTFGHPKGLSFTDLSRFLSYNTAKLARLHHRKGSIAVGMDADFVIWNPDEQITVTPEMLHFRHKLSPYLGKVLNGRVVMTVLRGQIVFNNDAFVFDKPQGILLAEPLE